MLMWEIILIGLICGVYLVICLAFVNIISWPNIQQYTENKHLKNVKNVVFVIAHPDDECMFFSPSIIRLCQDAVRVYLLCLSTGNYDGLGNQRKKELLNSTKHLGIDSDNVMIINHTNLPDDNLVVWNRSLVGRIIVKYVHMWDINTLITFDKNGVSGHNNHCAINEAVRSLIIKDQFPPCSYFDPRFNEIDVNIFRKYFGIFDVPLTYLFSNFVYVSTRDDIRRGQEAMSAHASQMVWFRKLYISFSRYMVINDFKRLSKDILDSDLDSDDD